MPKLINIELPKQGGDPRELWQTVRDLINALNDLTVTVVPTAPAVPVKISDGDIQIDLSNYISVIDATNQIPGWTPGGGGTEDAPPGQQF